MLDVFICICTTIKKKQFSFIYHTRWISLSLLRSYDVVDPLYLCAAAEKIMTVMQARNRLFASLFYVLFHPFFNFSFRSTQLERCIEIVPCMLHTILLEYKSKVYTAILPVLKYNRNIDFYRVYIKMISN